MKPTQKAMSAPCSAAATGPSMTQVFTNGTIAAKAVTNATNG